MERERPGPRGYATMILRVDFAPPPLDIPAGVRYLFGPERDTLPIPYHIE